MSQKTYMELCKNNKSTIQINAWDQRTGQPFNPSGAYYQVNGSRKDNVLISKSPAQVYQNQIWATITQSITVSATEYDLLWEIHGFDGTITNHCTKVLVVDTC